MKKHSRKFRILFLLLLIIAGPFEYASAKTIGVIMTGDIKYYQDIHDAFLKKMNQQGLKIVLQKPMPDAMSWTNTSRKLATLGCDLIIAYGAPATLSTMKETSDIPILFAGVPDPDSMNITGKNATGISSTVSVDIIIKNLMTLSKFSKLGVILSKSEKDTILQTKTIKKNEGKFGFKSVLFTVSNKVKKGLIKDVDALLITSCSAGMMNIKEIIAMSRKDKIPSASLIGGGENEGVVFTMSANPEEQGRELAEMANKVLAGAKPGEIPVKRPQQIEIIINLKEARAMGIDISADLKSSATKVIE